MPVWKKQVIVEVGFLLHPHIESLVHDEKTHNLPRSATGLFVAGLAVTSDHRGICRPKAQSDYGSCQGSPPYTLKSQPLRRKGLRYLLAS